MNNSQRYFVPSMSSYNPIPYSVRNIDVTPVRPARKSMAMSNGNIKSYTNTKNEGKGITGWVEESISKLSSSGKTSNLFDNTIFSGSKYDNQESEDRPRYKSKPRKAIRVSEQAPNVQSERPREYYCQKETGDRISRIQANNIELLSRENSMTSSMYSLNPSTVSLANEVSVQDDAGKQKFVEKYNNAKAVQKKYKKEVKVLKMEKRKLQIKNRELTLEREVS